MKFYTRLLLTIAAIIVCGITLFINITSSYRSKRTDTLQVNDLKQSVKEQWDYIASFDHSEFSDEMIIFDCDEFVVYSDIGNELKNVNSVEDAVNKGCLCMSVSESSRLMGTIIIPDPDKAKYDITKQKLVAAAMIMALLFILAGVLYGSYVRKNIIVPFKKMEKFAVNVASGSLDEPIMLEKNNLFGAFTESFDIMREELAESKKREIELQRKEKELIASLSHDLKTPITGIKLTTELLEAKLNKYISEEPEKAESETDMSKDQVLQRDTDILDKLDNIYKKADQIDSLVNDLFSATMEDLGEFKVNCSDKESTILSEIIKKNDSKGLVTETELPKIIINIDDKRMSQVIGNIISNSYKYAGTRIDVDYGITDKYLKMVIKDYGPGVSRDELELITNKFYRGKKAESANKEGSGLGLYIAKSLMIKMNGELICDSDTEGFLVTLMIPIS